MHEIYYYESSLRRANQLAYLTMNDKD